MEAIAWDSWAFLEVALNMRRGADVERLWAQTPVVVTSRDVIGETFNFIVGRARSNEKARDWLDAANKSRIRIVDVPFERMTEYVADRPGATRASWTDLSLACVAEDAGARKVATDDGGFWQLGLEPVFAGGD